MYSIYDSKLTAKEIAKRLGVSSRQVRKMRQGRVQRIPMELTAEEWAAAEERWQIAQLKKSGTPLDKARAKARAKCTSS